MAIWEQIDEWVSEWIYKQVTYMTMKSRKLQDLVDFSQA